MRRDSSGRPGTGSRLRRRDSDPLSKRSTAAIRAQVFNIGDDVICGGRRHRAIGFTPMSVVPLQIELEDVVTGERARVELADLWCSRRQQEKERCTAAVALVSSSPTPS